MGCCATASHRAWTGALEDLIDESAQGGDELASMVHSLDLKNGRVTLVMCDEDDEDTSEEAPTRKRRWCGWICTSRRSPTRGASTSLKKAAAVKTAKTKVRRRRPSRRREEGGDRPVDQVKAGIRTMGSRLVGKIRLVRVVGEFPRRLGQGRAAG